MKQREWWIYQKSQSDSPWAIHLFVTKHYRSIRCDSEVYADWLPTASKRMVVGEMSIVQPDRWIEYIHQLLDHFGHPLTDQDKEQLRNEINEIKLSFKW